MHRVLAPRIRYCEALGPAYYEDDRFHTFAGRGQYNREWMDTIDRMVADYAVDEVVTRLRQAEVPVAPVLDPHDVYLDPQIAATGLLKETDHPITGRIRHPRAASAFFGVDASLAPAPAQGENTLEILQELGISDERANALLQEKTVKQQKVPNAG